MTLIKSLLLGSAAGIVAVATAQAADLPTRKAAPVEYVRVCNVGGITGWTLPGSDTCVKFSGYMTAHVIGGNLSSQYNDASAIASAIEAAVNPFARAHLQQTLMVQGSDVSPTVFNGSAHHDHSARRRRPGRCHGATGPSAGRVVIVTQPEECDFQSQYDRMEHPRQSRLRHGVEHRLWPVDWSL